MPTVNQLGGAKQSGIVVPYVGVANEIISSVFVALPFENQGEPSIKFSDELRAIWDTGATKSCIKQSLADEFDLLYLRDAPVLSANGSFQAKVYAATLLLPTGALISDIELIGCDDSIGSSILLGMDVITLGTFLVNTYNGQTTFSFQIPATNISIVPKDAKVYKQSYSEPQVGRKEPCTCGSGKRYKHCCGSSKV